MKKILLLALTGCLLFTHNLYSQSCPNDIAIQIAGADLWDMETDALNNVYVIGGYQGSITVGTENFTFTPALGFGLFVAKYDETGAFVWANEVTLPGINDSFWNVNPTLTLSNDNIIVASLAFIESFGGQTLRVASYTNSAAWTENWVNVYDPTSNGAIIPLPDGSNPQILPYDADVDALGNIYISGETAASILIGDSLINPAANVTESFLFKLAPSGADIWAIKSSGSAGRSRAWKVKVDDVTSSVYVGGDFQGAVSYNGINTVGSPTLRYGYITKFDQNGSSIWTRSMSSTGSFTTVYGLDFDTEGNVFFSGTFSTRVTIQGTTLIGYGGGDNLFGKFDTNGNLQWVKHFGTSSSSSNEFASSVSYGLDGGVYYTVQILSTDLRYNGEIYPGEVIAGLYLVKVSNATGDIDWISARDVFSYSAIFGGNGRLYTSNGTNLRWVDVDARPLPMPKVLTPNGVLLNPTVTIEAYNETGYTFQWYRDGALLPGENNVTLVATDPGFHYPEVANSNGCTTFALGVLISAGVTLESDSLALAALYESAGGPAWFRRTNWLSGPVATWEGVVVNGGRVERLFLDQNNMNGTIPPAFWNLTGLIEFRLWGNVNLNVQLTPSISNLTLLEVFDFGNCNVSGTLDAVATLPLLRELQLYEGKNITGSIPNAFATRTTLTTFTVSNNKLSGTMPSGIWTLPALQHLDVGGNGNLTVALPANLGTLTQFRTISIWGTVPIKGTFPTGFTSLVNLERLELGGHRMTGTIPTALGNLTQLRSLGLTFNLFSGAFPASVASITTLERLSLENNRFTSFPDFSNSPGLQILNIATNPIDFSSILPNLDNGISAFTYAPVSRRDDVWTEVNTGATFNFTNPFVDTPGNSYQWIFNNDTIPGATSRNLSVTNFNVSKLGGYICRVANSNLPGVILSTNFWNIALSGPPRSWTVDNNPGSVADFRDLYAAVYGTNNGDTLYIAGSATPYGRAGMLINSPRVIVGPGYFLNDNSGHQVNTESAKINQAFTFRAGSDGSVLTGLEFTATIGASTNANQIIINNSFFSDGDTVRNITITRNKFNGNAFITPVSHVNGLTVSQNFGGRFLFYGRDDSSVRDNDNGVYRNFTISNNINMSASSFFSQWPITVARNVMQNISVQNNIINDLRRISGMTLQNNVIRVNEAVDNTDINNILIDYTGGGVFENASGSFTTDSDYRTAIGSPIEGSGQGAFEGSNPYVLSGVPNYPSIYEIEDAGRLRFIIKAKNNQSTTPEIRSISYIIAQNGVVAERGTVNRFTPQDSIEFGFRPRLSNLTPNGTYDIFYRVRDANGKRSVFAKTSFTASVTTVTGTVVDSDDAPVTAGSFYLFEVNIEGTGFDTLAAPVANGTFVLPNVVIGDYLAAGVGASPNYDDHLPTYFDNTVFWEEADTLAIDDTNNQVAVKLILNPESENGEGLISGVFFEDVEETDGRGEARTPIARAGASVRRARSVSSGRPSEIVYDLIAYVQTDENGEFILPQLVPGEYRINLQYPGYPMNENSFIDITVGADEDTREVKVEAEVKDGLIEVRKVEITNIKEDPGYLISVYPNPSNSTITVKEENSTLTASVYLMDSMGRTLKQKSGELAKGITTAVSELQAGVYFMRVVLPGKGVVKISRVVITN